MNKKIKRTAFVTEIFCNTNVFTVSSDPFVESLLNKSIHFFNQRIKNLLNGI